MGLEEIREAGVSESGYAHCQRRHARPVPSTQTLTRPLPAFQLDFDGSETDHWRLADERETVKPAAKPVLSDQDQAPVIRHRDRCEIHPGQLRIS